MASGPLRRVWLQVPLTSPPLEVGAQPAEDDTADAKNVLASQKNHGKRLPLFEQENIVVSTDREFRNVEKIEIVGLQRKSVLRAWVLVRNRQHCHLVHHGWNGK